MADLIILLALGIAAAVAMGRIERMRPAKPAAASRSTKATSQVMGTPAMRQPARITAAPRRSRR